MPRRPEDEDGFTLVELIVVTMIASVVLLVLGSAIIVATRTMRESEAREITSEVRTEARKVILADLQSATSVVGSTGLNPRLAIRNRSDLEYTVAGDGDDATCPDREDPNPANHDDETVFKMTSMVLIRTDSSPDDPDQVIRTAEYRLTDHPSFGCSLVRVLRRDGVDANSDGEEDIESLRVVVRHIDPRKVPAVRADPMCGAPFAPCLLGPAIGPDYLMPQTWNVHFNVMPFPVSDPDDYASGDFSFPVSIIGQRRVDTTQGA